ncbi:hypothetical protein VNO80_22908 [Phaseolus coccineus]|uniref:Transmembrane protein n=1 Tax=Phaseolus coccineus TaxID=3886 RepID=A0AAN9M4Y6_PHACN
MKKRLNYRLLKTSLQFVLSVSVFSFFLCYSSGFSILLLTRTLQRKYMFIICNAILALLAIHVEFQASTSATKAQVSEEAVGAFLTIEEQEFAYSEQVSAAELDTDAVFIAEGGTGNSSEVMVAKDDELAADTTVETNEDEVPNTDELNRKFEEFIRKMKEEMRIEAEGQPIEV